MAECCGVPGGVAAGPLRCAGWCNRLRGRRTATPKITPSASPLVVTVQAARLVNRVHALYRPLRADAHQRHVKLHAIIGETAPSNSCRWFRDIHSLCNPQLDAVRSGAISQTLLKRRPGRSGHRLT